MLRVGCGSAGGAPTASWGGRTRDGRRNPRLLLGVRRRQKMSFGSVARRRRKPPAAGSHAEIRQPFICSTPACLEKYGVNALKRSFNRALRGFFGGVYFYFIFNFALARVVVAASPILGKGCVWGGGQGSSPWRGALRLCKLAAPLVSGEGRAPAERNPTGFAGWWGKHVGSPPNFAVSHCHAGPCCRLGSSRTAARREITGPGRGGVGTSFP